MSLQVKQSQNMLPVGQNREHLLLVLIKIHMHEIDTPTHSGNYNTVEVVDESGSMKSNGGEQQARNVMLYSIVHATPGDQMSLLTFSNGHVEHLHNEQITVGNKDMLVKRVEQIRFRGGGTDPVTALTAACLNFEQAKNADAYKRLLFITDGAMNDQSTTDQTSHILKKIHASGVNTIAFGCGSGCDFHFLSQNCNEAFYAENVDQLTPLFQQASAGSTSAQQAELKTTVYNGNIRYAASVVPQIKDHGDLDSIVFQQPKDTIQALVALDINGQAQSGRVRVASVELYVDGQKVARYDVDVEFLIEVPKQELDPEVLEKRMLVEQKQSWDQVVQAQNDQRFEDAIQAANDVIKKSTVFKKVCGSMASSEILQHVGEIERAAQDALSNLSQHQTMDLALTNRLTNLTQRFGPVGGAQHV